MSERSDKNIGRPVRIASISAHHGKSSLEQSAPQVDGERARGADLIVRLEMDNGWENPEGLAGPTPQPARDQPDARAGEMRNDAWRN